MAVRLPVESQIDEDSVREQEIFAEINITPFTDVILVLLIIFMVSSSAMLDAARDGHLDVSLPQAGHATASDTAETTLIVGIAADERLFVHNAFIDHEAFLQVLKKTYRDNAKTTIIVDADGQLPHHIVVRTIDEIRAAGFETIGIGAETSP